MTQQEINDGNKLISIFMDQAENTPYSDKGTFIGDTFFLWEEMRYHELWEWVMPVVEKIEDCKKIDTYGFSVIIDNWQCKIKSCLSGNYVSTVLHGESKITAVWRAVVQFIKWFNAQSK